MFITSPVSQDMFLNEESYGRSWDLPKKLINVNWK